MWRANYHPDGGQMFFPLEKAPFVVPLALPGDDVTPAGLQGLLVRRLEGPLLHPNVWHDGVFPATDTGRYFGKQGKVHARQRQLPERVRLLPRCAAHPRRALAAVEVDRDGIPAADHDADSLAVSSAGSGRRAGRRSRRCRRARRRCASTSQSAFCAARIASSATSTTSAT